MVLGESEEVSPDIALSERLARLAAAHGEIDWPEALTTAVTALKTSSDRVAILVTQVADYASSLGGLAAVMADNVAGDCPSIPSPAEG